MRGMNIISYCTDGLANRLIPLACAHTVSEVSGRKLLVYWDDVQKDGCLAKFSELFENEIDMITQDEMEQLEDCVIFSEAPLVTRGGVKYKRFIEPHGYGAGKEEHHGKPALRRLGKKYFNKRDGGLMRQNKFRLSSYEHKKNIIVLIRGFYLYHELGDDMPIAYDFLRSLVPVKELREKIGSLTESLSLNKDVVGVHARGTDFEHRGDLEALVNEYESKIKEHLNDDPSATFFVATEHREIDFTLREIFGDKIRSYTNKKYLRKENLGIGWPENFTIGKEEAKDAVIDLFLLAQTKLLIFSQRSSYGELAKILSEGK